MTHRQEAEYWIDLLRSLNRGDAVALLASRFRLTEVCAKAELMAEVQAEFKRQFGDLVKGTI